jgi:hypothetical protein
LADSAQINYKFSFVVLMVTTFINLNCKKIHCIGDLSFCDPKTKNHRALKKTRGEEKVQQKRGN